MSEVPEVSLQASSGMATPGAVVEGSTQPLVVDAVQREASGVDAASAVREGGTPQPSGSQGPEPKDRAPDLQERPPETVTISEEAEGQEELPPPAIVDTPGEDGATPPVGTEFGDFQAAEAAGDQVQVHLQQGGGEPPQEVEWALAHLCGQ